MKSQKPVGFFSSYCRYQLNVNSNRRENQFWSTAVTQPLVYRPKSTMARAEHIREYLFSSTFFFVPAACQHHLKLFITRNALRISWFFSLPCWAIFFPFRNDLARCGQHFSLCDLWLLLSDLQQRIIFNEQALAFLPLSRPQYQN